MQASTGNGPTTPGDEPSVQENPSSNSPSRHFPQTLVAMDPPTLPAAHLTAPPSEFRQFPTPQRSVPGHPTLRRRLRRVLLFWRRGA